MNCAFPMTLSTGTVPGRIPRAQQPALGIGRDIAAVRARIGRMGAVVAHHP